MGSIEAHIFASSEDEFYEELVQYLGDALGIQPREKYRVDNDADRRLLRMQKLHALVEDFNKFTGELTE